MRWFVLVVGASVFVAYGAWKHNVLSSKVEELERSLQSASSKHETTLRELRQASMGLHDDYLYVSNRCQSVSALAQDTSRRLANAEDAGSNRIGLLSERLDAVEAMLRVKQKQVAGPPDVEQRLKSLESAFRDIETLQWDWENGWWVVRKRK